uniref:Heg39 CDS n=1 Tax=Fusarium culmorum TaxID=5516 RepID=A0A0F6QIV0_FUSCU|nr:LAGLIDADG endonuclease [Fusarium culmorum]AKE07474.1 LAGLIDADG endonuclease [Fusarium culmorum]QID42336.1 LAGLIDADG endonuclease [Fusarium culmorum]QID42395.1 LAGLIDADG endonuclease [Fusarium culmorum]QID42452.1 LAGLIDADG endonuclease [Fusarium culmorum]QID42509.1 LAGLIDADG endonuclease [Fusarium culmorum]
MYIYNILNTKHTTEIDTVSSNSDKLLITLPESNHSYFIDKQFIEWLVGFTDAEGNFHIKLTDLQGNTFKYVQFTYQIGLHEDEVEVLEYIMNTLKCGHISKSKGKVNYFVNDLNSLLNIIIPIFNYVNLNSSKYHHFVSFSKAVVLRRSLSAIKGDSRKLSETSKSEIIKLKKEMSDMSGKWIPSSINDKIIITKFWLAGFIDGEGTFSTNKYIPRFKLENNIKELELYNKIREFLNTGKVLYISSRLDKVNSNPTVIFELNKIKELRDNLIPLMYHDGNVILKTLKYQDFLLWLKLVDIYYNGYHTISRGKFIFDSIKLHMNKYRLTTNSNLLKDKEFISMKEIDNLMSKLYLINSPYEIKNNYRYYRNTNNLVSESTKIIVIKDNEYSFHESASSKMYNSMTECAKDINISRKYIKECLISGKSYKGYTFVLN